jgi:GTPase SAR1 family protein
MLEAAKQPFRLGIIGEFRVGKSTLINALLGQEVAFTDVLEATATTCYFHHGDENYACFHYKDGNQETVSFQDAMEVLDTRREDEVWLKSVDHVEYSVCSERLRDFDLWDAPGLGGRDDNERLANEFLETLGGAIWVIDITLVGKASIARPLAHLKQTGKTVIGVLNRIDEYDGDLDDAIQFVQKAYPGIFSKIIPISGLEALETTLEGQVHAPLEALWATVLNTYGKDQSQGAEARINSTLKVAGNELGQAIGNLRRTLQDQVGLGDHLQFNLSTEKKRLLLKLPTLIRSQADKVFDELESEIWRNLEATGHTPQEREQAIEHLVAKLNDEKTYEFLACKISDRIAEDISEQWFKLTHEAINLSRTALAIRPSSPKGPDSNSMGTHHRLESKVGLDHVSREALDEAYYTGGVSAVVAGTLAAASASITWPVVICALPIAALAAWKKQRDLNRSNGGLLSHIRELLSKAKLEFMTHYPINLESELGRVLDEEIQQIIARKLPEEVGVESQDVLRSSLGKLVFLEGQSGMKRSPVDESISADTLLQNLAHVGDRLDILLTESDVALSPILFKLAPTTKVRLILLAGSNPGNLDAAMENWFGTWQGQKSARAVLASHPIQSSGLKGLLISAEDALQTHTSLARLADQDINFTHYPQGRLAAQRLFASLWEGKTETSQPLEIIPLL